MAPSEDPNRDAYEQMFNAAADAFVGQEIAYHAELGASALLGGVYRIAEPPRRVGVTNFAEPFTRHAARKRSRKACALLAALGAVAPEPAASLARDALQRLLGNGTSAPGWATGAGRVRCVEALLNQEIWGDKTQYLCLFEYESGTAGPDHLVVVTVDHASGQVDELGVLAPGRPALAGLRESADEYTSLVAGDLATMRAEMVAAIGRTDAAAAPPGPAYADQWAFVLARALALPGGGQPRPAMSEAARERLTREFMDDAGSPLALARGINSGVVSLGARAAIDWAVDVAHRDPLRWSAGAVETFLLEWMPTHGQLAPEIASWLPEILTAFVEHAGARRGLPPEAMFFVRERVVEISSAFTERMLGGESQESMTDVLERMLAAGVDPADDAAVRTWLEQQVEQSEKPDGRPRGEHS